MQIESLPIMLLFPDSDDTHKAVLRADGAGGAVRFSVTVETPRLTRMGASGDNAISVTVDGICHAFTASGISDIPSRVEILENNNKRSRYRISFSIEAAVPFSLSADAEGLLLT